MQVCCIWTITTANPKLTLTHMHIHTHIPCVKASIQQIQAHLNQRSCYCLPTRASLVRCLNFLKKTVFFWQSKVTVHTSFTTSIDASLLLSCWYQNICLMFIKKRFKIHFSLFFLPFLSLLKQRWQPEMTSSSPSLSYTRKI